MRLAAIGLFVLFAGNCFADEIAPTDATGRVLNLDFETGTLQDWTADGRAFEGQPIKGDTVKPRRGDMQSKHKGEFWIGGFEKLSDPPTGKLTSIPFTATHPYASFLVGGGQQAETRVEIVLKDGDKVVAPIAGKNDEAMYLAVVDLRAHQGKEIYIRLVDEAGGGWGHLNFDHFRFHSERPGPLAKSVVKLVDDQYPHGGLSAKEAAAAMTVPEGFTVHVGAAEPEVKQPIAMAIDDQGRVWIAEAYEYPQRAKGDKGRDRILIFEDTNGDGTLDKQKVFTEGLNLVSGLEVGFGGVWVGAAPYLLFIADADGDDVPDGEPKILLDGWGYQDTHETLNAFIWGPDGWLYGCHGVFTHSRVGKPGTRNRDRVPINAGIWRYHPTRHEFEVFSHGTSNPWGVDFDDHGQAFCTACVIPHLYYMIQGGRYQRQAGPHFDPHTYDDIKTIADHVHYLGDRPHGGNNKSDEAGGGHAHAGAMIYLGGAWPEKYRNQIFMNNIHGQRLNMDILKPAGSGYAGSHGPDFLLTGDKASQILNLRYGPDGQAWMIDWYDMQACHRPEIDIHDRSNGRIYKIVYGDLKPVKVDLDQKTDAELAEYVLDPNDWYVRHSRRILQERAAAGKLDKSVHKRLTEIATTNADDTRRLRAMWALQVTGGLDADAIHKLIGDKSPYVRGWLIQLALDHPGQPRSEYVAHLATLAATDPSPVVRLYIAAAAQRLPVDQRWNILSALASHPEDASDHNLPLMYWYAAEPFADADPERALAWALEAGESIPLLRNFMLRRIGSTDAGSSLALLVRGLSKTDDAKLQLTFLTAIRAALVGQRKVEAPADWTEAFAKLLKGSDPAIKLQAMALGATFGDQLAVEELREIVQSQSANTDQRRGALGALLSANVPQLEGTLHELISNAELRGDALRGLAQYEHADTPKVILAAYGKLTPDEKRAALGTLCARAPYALVLLKAIGDKQVAGTDLTADLVRRLQFLKNKEVDDLLAKSWGSARETAADKKEMIARMKELVADDGGHPADPALGRAIFAKTCQTCHTLYGVGNKIGPDLTGSNRADLDYLLSNIVDPSAVMAKEYQQTVIVNLDGQVIPGIVKEENDKAVTVQTAEAVVVVPKEEIDERELSDKSMMPDDQLKQFSEHEVRSLIAYLSGREQTPMLATKDNAVTLFNGKDLTGWTGNPELWSVENGELVGKSNGLRRNEWIISDLAAEDFHLTLEVKLVDNEGNSGIQFRSEAIEHGEVKGYQADVGAGWWGKLYEEHGRALLWSKSGEPYVKNGDWNKYEIIARGSKVVTKINGQTCVDLDDPKGARRGIFAPQLHSGGPTEVRFRNMKLEVFEPEHEEHAHAGGE